MASYHQDNNKNNNLEMNQAIHNPSDSLLEYEEQEQEHFEEENQEEESDAPRLPSNPADDIDADKLSYKEFLWAIWKINGAPQILFLCILLSFGFGTLAIAPSITSDRYARLRYGYTGPLCSSSGTENIPEACTLGANDAQAAAAYSTVVQYSLTFITSPFLGALSDRTGRKGFMAVGVFLFNMGPLFLFLVQTIPTMDPLWYFVLNCSPGLLSWFGLSYAVMSDVVQPKLRAPALALIQICAFSATTFVPVLAVVFGDTRAAFACSIFCILAFFFVICALPETLTEENKEVAILKCLDERKSGQELQYLLCRPIREMSLLNRNLFFRLIPFIVVINGMVTAGDKIILIFYVEGQLGFSEKDVSVLIIVHALIALCVQTFILKSLVQRIGERYVMIIAMTFGAIYNFIYGISNSIAMILFGAALSTITGMGYAVISSMMSFNVGEDEQGKAQGVFYSLVALSNAFGPTVMQLVFGQTKDGAFFGPGSMFILASAFYICGVIVSAALPPELANSRKSTEITENDEATISFEEENEEAYFA